MSTFHGDPKLKARLAALANDLTLSIDDLKSEREKLEWASKKWCPGPYVCQNGPTCDHSYYASDIGVPVALAYAERAIFLNLSTKHARLWWKRFFKALPVGCELDGKNLDSELSITILYRLLDFAQDAGQYKAIKTIIDLFMVRCENSDLWEAAAKQAFACHNQSPYNNNRLEANEARIHAGCMACYAAGYFARSSQEPRYIAEAIAWSGWPLRYMTYSTHMAKVEDPRKRVPVDDKGMVNLGTAMFASGQWIQASERADSLGEVDRLNHYYWVSQKLIELLEQANPTWSFVRIGRVLKRVAENWGTGQ